jgi:hypothetical protein
MSGYYPAGSMMGSGIYSTTITREVVCSEMCGSCEDDKITCEAVWEEDFETDDWGNVEAKVECKSCNHTFTYREERDYD